MSNPTSNFGWQMPTNSDLVTDLPADFEVFGQAVDTSLADLKGGTTGQVLSKATNTDMDFTWIDNQVGDITAITASSPITGGGTSGDVTIGIQDGTTTQKGALQLTDSTSSTSTTTAATPNSVRSAYDLANGAVAKSTATTKGDLFAATASATITRLGVGSDGYVLTASSGEATGLTWTAPSGGMTLLATINASAASSVSFTSISGSYKHLLLTWEKCYQSVGSTAWWGIRFNNDTTANRHGSIGVSFAATNNEQIGTMLGNGNTYAPILGTETSAQTPTYMYNCYGQMWIYDYTTYSDGVAGTWFSTSRGADNTMRYANAGFQYSAAAAISQIDFIRNSTQTITGTFKLWGVS